MTSGGVNIGIHLLWICSAAQVLAFLSRSTVFVRACLCEESVLHCRATSVQGFYWTYREITVDPVSVTLGLSQDPATK